MINEPVFVTQLIYILPGAESVFDEFESLAIPIIPMYNGNLLFRVRPTADNWIEGSLDQPYEIHLIEFASEADFQLFLKDPQRQNFLHLKEASVKTSMLVKGKKL